ncbi:Uncharacterised protein g10655 [Pycnogonum litorale]
MDIGPKNLQNRQLSLGSRLTALMKKSASAQSTSFRHKNSPAEQKFKLSNPLLRESKLLNVNTSSESSIEVLKRKHESVLSSGTLDDSSRSTKRIPCVVPSTPVTSEQSDDVSYNLNEDQDDELQDLDVMNYDSLFIQHDSQDEDVNPYFTMPEKNVNICMAGETIIDINQQKLMLINTVSVSLMKSPDFRSKSDEVRQIICNRASTVAEFDPEFILKLALYTRKVLYIRTTANFLLSFSANNKKCRTHLKKYFCASVNLPTDWIDVAEMYQHFDDSNLKRHSIPASLRRAMIKKFLDFDKYQLSKYNRQSKKSGGNKKTKAKKPANVSDAEDSSCAMEIDGIVRSEDENELDKNSFSLKQLVRLLHINDPVEHVMCLLGKTYPDSHENFVQSKLPGTFEESRAGTRMKFPTPETWETQISLRGNRACVWERLIDHEKLPYMATLRNLRNLVLSGISKAHHKKVTSMITNPAAVIHCKQFPFRFLSSFQAIEDLRDKEKFCESLQESMNTSEKNSSVEAKPEKKRWQYAREDKIKKKIESMKDYDVKTIKDYQKALNKAVDISMRHNVEPIKGNTYILLDCYNTRNVEVRSLKSLPKKLQKVREASFMLSMMCMQSCEASSMFFYSVSGHREVYPSSDSLLSNVQVAIDEAKELDASDLCHESSHPDDDVILDRLRKILKYDDLSFMKVDNIVLLGGSPSCAENSFVRTFLDNYRKTVNPHLLFVRVDVTGQNLSGCNASTMQENHVNDVYLSGFNDQVLRLIAERANGGQLQAVENIDVKFGLKPVAKTPLKSAPVIAGCDAVISIDRPPSTLIPKWHTCRVFISSTFRDMYCERDLLVRYVMPALRDHARSRYVNFYEVDLRWGVNREDSYNSRSVEVCLSQISTCQLFVGIIGERYGWIPESFTESCLAEFEWSREYPSRRSITELEIYHAALSDTTSAKDRAFFYFRNPEFLENVPEDYRNDFVEVDESNADKLNALKAKLRSSGLEVYDGYPCEWLGLYKGKLIVKELVSFGQRVKDNLSNAIDKLYPVENVVYDELNHEMNIHESFAGRTASDSIKRNTLAKKILNSLNDKRRDSAAVGLVGRAGCGKTSMMAVLYNTMHHPRVIHFVGLTAGSDNVAAMLRHIYYELIEKLTMNDVVIPDNYRDLVVEFPKFLHKATTCSPSGRVFVFVDGLDKLSSSHNSRHLDWLPVDVPSGVTFVFSVSNSTDVCTRLSDRSIVSFQIQSLDLRDRNDVINNMLGKYQKILQSSPFDNLLRQLTTKRDAGIPLYLELACRELRYYGTFDQMSKKIGRMSSTLPMLLQDILKRSEEEFGTALVQAVLLLITLSKRGLSGYDFHHLLQSYFVCRREEFENAMDQNSNVTEIKFVRLMRALETFMIPQTEKSGVYLLRNHQDVQNAIHKRYVSKLTKHKIIHLHSLLSEYYHNRVDRVLDGITPAANDTRALISLPYHLTEANRHETLLKLLTNLRYINVKLQVGLGAELLEDFTWKADNVSSMSRIGTKMKQNFDLQRKYSDFESFIRRNIHRLVRNPSSFLQLALNEPDTSSVSSEANSQMLCFDHERIHVLEWLNKIQDVEQSTQTVSGLSATPNCIVISHDGCLIYVGSSDGIVRSYDSRTLSEQRTFIGHSDAITCVSLVGKDKLCSSSADGTLSLWDVIRGNRLFVLNAHFRSVTDCCVDDNGMTIVSVGLDRKTCVWSVADGRLVSKLTDDRVPLNCVQFLPGKQEILVGGWNSLVRRWDLINMKMIAVFRGHNSSVRTLTVHPSGNYFASSSMNATFIWSIAQCCVLYSLNAAVNYASYSPSGQHLLLCENNSLNTVSVYKSLSGRGILSYNRDVRVTVLLLIEENRTQLNPLRNLYIGYEDGVLVQLTYIQHSSAIIIAKPQLKLSDGQLTVINDGPDKTILVGTSTGTVLMLEMDIQCDEPIIETISCPHPTAITCLNKCESAIFAGTADGKIYKFDSDDNSDVESYELVNEVEAHVGPVACIVSVPDDPSLLCSTGSDKMMYFWNVDGLKQMPMDFDERFSGPTSLSAIDGKSHVFAISDDAEVRYYEVDEEGIANSSKHSKLVSDSVISFKVYESFVVSGSSDGIVRVESVVSADRTVETSVIDTQCHDKQPSLFSIKLFKSFDDLQSYDSKHWTENDGRMIESNALSSLDLCVAATDGFGTVSVFMPFEMNEVAALEGHSDPATCARTSSDDQQIYSTSLDGTIRAWSINQSVRGSGRPDLDSVTCVSFSESGKYVATVGHNESHKYSKVVIWKVKSDERRSPKICYVYNRFDLGFVYVHATYVKFIEDDEYLLVGGSDGFMLCRIVRQDDRIVDVDTCDSVYKHRFHQTSFLGIDCYLPLQLVVQGTSDGDAILYSSTNPAGFSLVGKLDVSTDSPICLVATSDPRDGAFDDDDWSTVYTADLAGNIKRFIGHISSMKRVQSSIKVEQICTTQASKSKLYLAGKEPPSLPTSLAVCKSDADDDRLLIGDDSGRMLIVDPSNPSSVYYSLQIHSARITKCCAVNRCAFTCSFDGTVKVFRMHSDDEKTWRQLAQFDCRGPVTSLDVTFANGTGHVLLAAGDDVGNVYFLKWNPLDRSLIST